MSTDYLVSHDVAGLTVFLWGKHGANGSFILHIIKLIDYYYENLRRKKFYCNYASILNISTIAKTIQVSIWYGVLKSEL